MVVFILVFLVSWIVFFCLLQPKRFREIYPNSLLAMVLGLTSDVITDYVPIWRYQAPSVPNLLIKLLDDFGLYFVVSYFYIQFLPTTFKKWLQYTFLWTLVCLSFESMLLYSGHMTHQMGWSLWCSYVADWVILGIMTSHYLWRTGGARAQAKQKQHSHSDHVLLHNMADVVCYKNAEGRWMEANDATLSLLQLQAESYRGKTDLQLAENSAFLRETFVSFWEADKKTWEAGTPCRFIEIIPQLGGTIVKLDVTKIPTYDSAGRPKGILVLAMQMKDTVHETARTESWNTYEKPTPRAAFSYNS